MIPIKEERFCDLASKVSDLRLSQGNITAVDNIVQSERPENHGD